MKLVITRVREAAVEIDCERTAFIKKGLLILVGIQNGDTEIDVTYLAKKTAALRIFPDEAGKLNRSCRDADGELLVVSNFTLYADCRSGNRPSFTDAARPEIARPLYERFCTKLTEAGYTVKTGVFGADMLVSSQNDGPITIVMESPDKKTEEKK